MGSKKEERKARALAKKAQQANAESAVLQSIMNDRRGKAQSLRDGTWILSLMSEAEAAFTQAEQNLRDAIDWSYIVTTAGLGGTFHGRKAGRIVRQRLAEFERADKAWHAALREIRNG